MVLKLDRKCLSCNIQDSEKLIYKGRGKYNIQKELNNSSYNEFVLAKYWCMQCGRYSLYLVDELVESI